MASRQGITSDTTGLTNDDDDSISESCILSTKYTRKPTDLFEEENLEDGFVARRIRKKRFSWWPFRDIMTIRARRKPSLESMGYKDNLGDGEGLLAAEYTIPVPTARRKASWYNYFVFGGISGLTILGFLLILNLALTFVTLYWSPDIDSTLQNWGRQGSGTEGLSWYPTDFTRDIVPIPCHSHNDYWRRVPLFSALRAGCTGVEADVWLFDNELYVGHNTASLTRNRTFTSLYIDPLVNILKTQNPETDFYNGTSHGVFEAHPGQTLTLLVDVKTGGKETWPWVLEQLQPLRERGWLSFVENDVLTVRLITVVGTGNTPFDVLTANSNYRDAFFDAPLDTMWEPRHKSDHKDQSSHSEYDNSPPDPSDEDPSIAPFTPPTTVTHNLGQGLSGTSPESSFNTSNSYYASMSFKQAVGRVWRRRLTHKQIEIIRGQIRGAHSRGLKVRYWDTPAWPLGLRNHVWNTLIKEGADVLNVDDLRGASRVDW